MLKAEVMAGQKYFLCIRDGSDGFGGRSEGAKARVARLKAARTAQRAVPTSRGEEAS